jgi:hypothetical protein
MPCACRNVPLLLAIFALTGCTTAMHKGKSPLMPAQMSPDSVVLDIFVVRFPFGDPDVNEKLWQEIDEQGFPLELRDRLTQNGFRVGIVTGQMPMALSKLLELNDKPVPDGKLEETSLTSFETKPRVARQHFQLRAKQRGEIMASHVYDELPVFVPENGRLCGHTYRQAQGMLAVKSMPQPDGRVCLELAPELHHDQPRPQWGGNQGMMRLDLSRPRRVFDDMVISTNLSPGSMLVLSSLPNKPGSLGHHFFAENDDGQQQKLLIVRLSQTQPTGPFDASESLKLEE